MRQHCTPYKLPSNGVIQIAADYVVTLTSDAIFTPQCTSVQQTAVGTDSGALTNITDIRDPFHASITPQAYATGAATVIAWMLVIMLIITPRTFFVGGASGQSGLMGRRGMISGAGGGASIIGVGTRPWLQKVAALTVAISLTLATADTFEIAERQYEAGFMDAMKLRDEVVAGMEIKVSRVISDVFLWLAQVQTLIRLFPRHKEKVIIKWIGFALILLDITFSCLNSFGPYNNNRRPRHFETAIPALSYLFQLSLSMLYAAWVMYYAVTKRRYAFYHSMMWNITLVALLSIVAILTPVVFFITDISNYTIAGWGDYFRWVGAAAASVIVWEWVERIEALEREERKDGILGREVYDGDEMLETTPSHGGWARSQRLSAVSNDSKKPGNDDDMGGGGAFSSGLTSRTFSNLAHRLGRSRHQEQKTETQRARRTIHIPAPAPARRRDESNQPSRRDSRNYVPLPSPTHPPAIASPVSRTDTTSADSTVYTIRYHPISISPAVGNTTGAAQGQLQRTPSTLALPSTQGPLTNEDLEKAMPDIVAQAPNRWNWQGVVNPFRRRGRSPPPEVQRGRVIEPLGIEDVPANIPPRNYTGFALKDRLGTFAAQQGEKFRTKKNAAQQSEQNLPVTIIPAQPRGRTWSPEILLQQQQQEALVPTLAAQNNSGLDAQRQEGQRSRALRRELPTASSHRTSQVQFAPEVLQRPLTRLHPEREVAPSYPSPALSTTDHRDFQPPHTPEPPNPQAPEAENSIDQQQMPTNHDR
ncbi:PalH-domain-containing protein [Lophiostoma macrostomum CBS 122681]|uniref:PalH-domain-containing protein n=1 Tax=Lophiostoma macrostomum CBS 122681 TaxID=1314788 RepID=A0A6A6ST05_9PLEO|nr:PalH-domain-containing protein [Lophiostoma macrostomum CBS 122681]